METDTFSGIGFDSGELLQVAEAVARDKAIEAGRRPVFFRFRRTPPAAES